jgi:hypothetical protein
MKITINTEENTTAGLDEEGKKGLYDSAVRRVVP